MRLTREWLESADACSDAVEEFMAAFPDGAELTRELLDHETVRPHSDWLADHLPLSATAMAAYQAVRAPAMWSAYVASGLNEPKGDTE